MLIVPAGSPLARRGGRPSVRDIADLPLIGNRQCRSTAQVSAFFRTRGVEPRIVFRSDDNGTVQGLVAAGVGCALVPLLTVDAKDERTAVLELDPRIPPRVIGIAWHRDRYRSPAARAFVEVAQQVCSSLEVRPRAALSA